MPITLSNASRNITLNHILEYRLEEAISYPVKKVVGSTPRIDLNAKTMSPPERTIGVRVNTTDRNTLIAMKRDCLLITINDGNEYSGTPLMVLDRVEEPALVGTDEWTVTMHLLQSSNLT